MKKKFIATMITLNGLLFGSFLSANCINSKPSVESSQNINVSNNEFDIFYKFDENSFDDNIKDLALFYFFDSIPKISQNIKKQAVNAKKQIWDFEEDKCLNIALTLNDEKDKKLIEDHLKNFENIKTKNVDLKTLKKNYINILNSLANDYDYEKKELKKLIKEVYSEKIAKINKIEEKEFLKVLEKLNFTDFNPAVDPETAEEFPTKAKIMQVNYTDEQITSTTARNLNRHLFVENLYNYAKSIIEDEKLKKDLEKRADAHSTGDLFYANVLGHKRRHKVEYIYGSDELITQLKKIANSAEFKDYLKSQITGENLENLREKYLNMLSKDEKKHEETLKKHKNLTLEDFKKDQQQILEELEKKLKELEAKTNKTKIDKIMEKNRKENIKKIKELLNDPKKLKEDYEKSKEFFTKNAQSMVNRIKDFKFRLNNTTKKDLELASKMVKFEGATDFNTSSRSDKPRYIEVKS